MPQSSPEVALSNVPTGRWCDACNRAVRSGDLVRCYATYYASEGWVPRRVWCRNCGFSEIERGTPDVDEAIVTAVFWNHHLVSVKLADRSRPEDGEHR